MVDASSKLDPQAFVAKGLPLDYVLEVIPKLEAAGIAHYRQLVALSTNSLTLGQVAGKLRMKPNNLLVLCKAADQILVDAVVHNPAFQQVKSMRGEGSGTRQGTAAPMAIHAAMAAVAESLSTNAKAEPESAPSQAPARPVVSVAAPGPGSAIHAEDWRVLEVPRSTAEQVRELAELMKQRKPNSNRQVGLTPTQAHGGLNYAALLPPVRDQRQQALGAVFALTAVHELFVRSFGKEQHLSERHLWENARTLAEPHASLAAAALALAQTGQCRAQTWTLDAGDKVPLNARSEGSNFRPMVLPMERPTAAAVIRELEAGRLVAVRLPLSLVWISNSMQGQAQLMEMIAASAGHALTVIGFGQEHGQQVLYLRNSWGTGWGTDHVLGPGHGTVTAEMFDKVVTEAYRLA